MIGRVAKLLAGAALLAICTGCPPPTPPLPPPPPAKPVAPEPTVVIDPAPVTDGDVTVAYANGLRILVQQRPDAELVSMQLYIKGGARLRTKESAGLELLALRIAVNGGTKTLDKQAFGKKLSALGSEMGASSRHAYSIIGAKSLTSEFAATLQMLSEAFLHPAMPTSEFEIRHAQQLSAVKNRDVDPDGRLSLLVLAAMYRGHPFENLPDGTVESMAGFTPPLAEKHLETLRQTSRLQLVVAGNVSADEVQRLAQQYFGKLPRGDYRATTLPTPTFRAPTANVVLAKLPTNYIEASFIGPDWGDKHFAASILTMRLLSRRLFDEVRTKRNLSYAPSAHYGWSGDISRGSLYVTAVKANTTIKVMHDEVRKLKTTLVGETELRGAKSVFVTRRLMANESTNGQASWLAICDIIGGDWRLSRTLTEQVKAVQPAAIQAFAKQYIKNLQTVVLGDPEKIDKALFNSL